MSNNLSRLFSSGYTSLTASIALTIGFAVWVSSESELEAAQQTTEAYNQLMSDGQRQQAQALFAERLNTSESTPLGIEWLQVVNMMSDKHDRLHQYLRILRDDPAYEQTYIEIAYLLQTSGEDLNLEQRTEFLTEIHQVKGLDLAMLEKYQIK